MFLCFKIKFPRVHSRELIARHYGGNIWVGTFCAQASFYNQNALCDQKLYIHTLAPNI